MSDLTREEIRRACLAVGWPEPISDDEFHLDPVALLEGWRADNPKQRFYIPCSPCEGEGKPYFEVGLYEGENMCKEWRGSGPDLPTAAVRAVNQATQTPGDEPREGGETP